MYSEKRKIREELRAHFKWLSPNWPRETKEPNRRLRMGSHHSNKLPYWWIRCLTHGLINSDKINDFQQAEQIGSSATASDFYSEGSSINLSREADYPEHFVVLFSLCGLMRIPGYRSRGAGSNTGCNNYRGISLLSTSYKILSNILLSRLSQYIDQIIRNHQCGFRRNRSTTDKIVYNSQIL
jgi:hypothetical protein